MIKGNIYAIDIIDFKITFEGENKVTTEGDLNNWYKKDLENLNTDIKLPSGETKHITFETVTEKDMIIYLKNQCGVRAESYSDDISLVQSPKAEG